MNIKEFIPEGEANAISMKELSLRIGATERETRRLVLSARRNDAPLSQTVNVLIFPDVVKLKHKNIKLITTTRSVFLKNARL